MTDRPSRRDALHVGASVALVTATAAAWPASASAADPLRRRFRDATFPITRYGAAEDTDCTGAIAAAISACHSAGGGHVIVPAGRWPTGGIRLLSNVDLHVAPGATLEFSTDPAAYLPVVLTRWQGVELYNYAPLIHAHGQRNIAVTGGGVLDAQGDNEHWWFWIGSGKYGWRNGLPNQRDDWALLETMGEQDVPVSQRVFGDGHYLRPSFISPHQCRDVLIEGVTLRHSPMWNIHPIYCANVLVQDVTIDSLGPNGDGCDPDSCSDVTIRRVSFATHDDCIAIKSGRDQDGRRVGQPSSRIRIEDCTFVSGGGAVAIGSEMSGGVRDVRARRLRLPLDPNATDAEVANVLSVKSTSSRGGYIRDVRVDDVVCTGPTYVPFDLTYQYMGQTDGAHYPDVSDLAISRWQIATSHIPYRMRAVPQAPVRHVRLDDCRFSVTDQAPDVEYVADLQLHGVTIGSS